MQRSVNILIVEDSKPDLVLIQRRLAGCKRITATTDEAGWLNTAEQLLRLKTYDLIFLDLGLPDSQGVDTVYSIHKVAPTTPIVVMSGHEDMESAITAIRAGAQDYLIKEVDLTPERIERVILYSIQRADNDFLSKSLIRQSIETVSYSSSSSPVAGMISSHIDNLEKAMHQVLDYLRKNHPPSAEAVELILKNRDWDMLFKESRATLGVEADTPRRQRLSKESAQYLERISSGGQSGSAQVLNARDAEAVLSAIVGAGAADD